MLVGTVKVLRMIVLRVFTLLLVLFLTTSVHAETEVYVGPNVYKPTVKRWENAVKNANFRSVTWIWSLGVRDRKHKNGSRDTILMVPEVSNSSDITLVVWFHGCSGFSQKTFTNRLIPQIETLVKQGNSLAIAIPEMPWSINTSTRCKRQGRVWRSPGDLEKYVDSLREHLQIWALVTHKAALDTVRIVFVGHSAGGSAIASAAKEGSLCRLAPEAVIWSDASYGSWLDKAWKGCISKIETDLHVLVRKWDKPHKNADRLIKSTRGRDFKATILYQILNRKKWKHRDIGNSVFSLTDVFPPGC